MNQPNGDDAASLAPTESLSAPVEGPHLRPGERLGDRFVIVQFLARGGMGEVYEAVDQNLQSKHIAIKTLRPEIATDLEMRTRFEREVLLAREVNHRNVCPTYDLLRLDGPRGSLLCLSMKLLNGESLAALLRRQNPMPLPSAIPIARQLAAGMDAAHAAGVIHRDFKPGNVIVEYSGETPHVYVTDFGLSRLHESDQTIGRIGQIAGTRGYIAPELFEGRTASPASDVYAFGVVLYELLTGQQPVLQPGSRGFRKPTSLRPELPPIWDRVILGCLAADPGQRLQSAGEAMALLDGSSAPAPPQAASTRPRPWLWAGIGLTLSAGAVFLATAPIDSWLRPLPERRFVAVFASPPSPAPADAALLDNVIDRIDTRLVRAESYVKDLLIIGPGDLSQQKSAKPEDAILASGANLALTVSVATRSQELTLTLSESASRKVLRQTSLRMNRAELARVPEQAATAAARLLGLPGRPQHWKEDDEIALLNTSAYELFTAAEDLRRQPNDAGLDQAIEKYRQVLDSEATFALGYAKIALAYVRKYQITRDNAALVMAQRNSELAIQHSPDSPNAVLSQALVFLYSGNPSQAVEALAAALKLDPGNADTLFYEAVAYRNLNRPRDEENIYREIIVQRPNYYRAYNELGWSLYRQGRYAESATAFGEAAQIAPRQALPLTNLGAVYLLLGRKQDAIAAFRASLERAPSELAYLNLGNIWFEQGNYPRALESYEKARDLKPTDDLTWRNLGDCYAVVGDRNRMIESYAKAAGLLSEHLKTSAANGPGWMTLAFYEAKLGHRAEAEQDLRKADANGSTDVESQFTKAQTLAVLGRTGEAINLLVSCVRQGLSLTEVQLALDLKDIRSDSRFVRQIGAPVSGVKPESKKEPTK